MYERPNGFAGSVVILVEALILALVATGFLKMDSEQTQLWVNVATAVVIVLVPVFGFLWTKRWTTPLVRPKDIDGTALRREGGATPLEQAAMRK